MRAIASLFAGALLIALVSTPAFAYECPKHFEAAEAAIKRATEAMEAMPHNHMWMVHTLLDDAKMLLHSATHNHEKPAAGGYDHARALAKADASRGIAEAAELVAKRLR